MAGPLEGIKVVELGVWVAGPAAGGILADWGADVIKIEPPTGDPARMFGRMLGIERRREPAVRDGQPRQAQHRRWISPPKTVADARSNCSTAQTFSSPTSARARYGASAWISKRVAALNPRLVYGLITGYGETGPDADRAAYDVAAFWARAGLAHLLTRPGDTPPFQRGGMGDHTAGMTLAAAVCAALVARARTGDGQLVSTSLYRQGAYTISFDLNTFLLTGHPISVGQRETMANPCMNNYVAGDGRAVLDRRTQVDRHWPALCRVVGRLEWID